MKAALFILLLVALAWALSGQTDHPAGLSHYRAGSIPLTALETTKAITFTTPMPDTNYSITLTPGLASSLSWSAKAASGLTLTLTVGLTGRVDYLAVKHQ